VRLNFWDSRKRIFRVFLLIRYTGAKLNEVLSLKPTKAIDIKNHAVRFINSNNRKTESSRSVQIPAKLSNEIKRFLSGISVGMKDHGEGVKRYPHSVRRLKAEFFETLLGDD